MKKLDSSNRSQRDEIEPQQCTHEAIFPQPIDPRYRVEHNSIGVLTNENLKLKKVLCEMSELLLDSDHTPTVEPKSCIVYSGTSPVNPPKQAAPSTSNLCTLNISKNYILNLLQGKKKVVLKIPKHPQNCYITIHNAPCSEKKPQFRRGRPVIDQRQVVKGLPKRIEEIQVPQKSFDEYGLGSPPKQKLRHPSYILHSENRSHIHKTTSISDNLRTLPCKEVFRTLPSRAPLRVSQARTKSRDQKLMNRKPPFLTPRGTSEQFQRTPELICNIDEIPQCNSIFLNQKQKSNGQLCEVPPVNLADYIISVPAVTSSPAARSSPRAPRPVHPSISVKKRQRQALSAEKVRKLPENTNKESIYEPKFRNKWKSKTSKYNPPKPSSRLPSLPNLQNDEQRLQSLDEKISWIESLLYQNRTALPIYKKKDIGLGESS